MDIPTLKTHLAAKQGAQSSYPFPSDTLAFKVMGKLFALIMETEARVTLKCDPDDTDILVSQFEAVTPGYHMNKRHWITLSLDGDVEDDLLIDLLDSSYALVVKKLKKADRERLEGLQ